MSLKEQIIDDMKSAMRAKEKERLSVLRMVKSAVMNKEIDKGGELDDDEILKMLNTLVKQRRDSANQYEKAGRPELASAELSEIEIIEVYLPASATDDEIDAAIAQSIEETEASTMKEMGSVMKAVNAKLAGKTTDGKVISEKVRAKLQA